MAHGVLPNRVCVTQGSHNTSAEQLQKTECPLAPPPGPASYGPLGMFFHTFTKRTETTNTTERRAGWGTHETSAGRETHRWGEPTQAVFCSLVL